MTGGAENLKGAQVLDVLTSLVDKSLVVVEETPSGMRFRLLDTVRQHSKEKLQEEDELQWAGKHFDYFSDMVRTAEPEFTGRNSVASFETLDREHENLRSALEFARVSDPDPGLEMAASLWRFWYVRGHMAEGRSWLEKLLEAANVSTTPGRAKAFHGLGILSIIKGDRESSIKYHSSSLAIRRELNDEAGIAYSLSALGAVADEAGDFLAAREKYEESLAIFRRLGIRHGITINVINLGKAVSRQGDFDAARPLLEESIKIARASGDLRNLAIALNNLATIELDDGNVGAAEAGITQSKALFEQIGDPWGVALTLTTMGRMYQMRGDLDLAYEVTKQSLEQMERAGDLREGAEQHFSLASICFDQGDIESAKMLCRKGIAAFPEIQDRWLVSHVLALLGSVWSGDDPKFAAFIWGAGERLREEIGAALLKITRASYEKSLALARERLSASDFDAEWKRGRDADFDEVMAVVLEL